LWILALVGLAVDQASKYAVFAWLREVPENRATVIPGVFTLVAQQVQGRDGVEPHVNHGALFGLLQWLGGRANAGFAIISLIAAAAIIVWSSQRSTARDRGLCVALGLILAGTLGNFYDRIVFGGVRDFVHWYYKDVFNWPVFNIADCCLVIGAGLLLIQAFRAQPKPEETPADPMLAVQSPSVEARHTGFVTQDK